MGTTTRDAPPVASVLSHRLVESFADFSPGYLRWVESQMRASELSFPRMRLLWVLHCGGPQTMSALRNQLGVTPGNVTALVDGLERQGLVRRRPHPSDRRAIIVELTDDGTAKCDSAYAHDLDAVAGLFEDLTATEQRDLLRIMERLHAGLRRRGFISAPRPVVVPERPSPATTGAHA